MMEIQRIAIKSLALNEGQVEGLPRNPRTWTRDELDRLARSIEETPELFEARPVLAYDWKDGEPFIVLGGNMRLTAAKQLGWKDVPCIVYPRGTERDKLKEIVIKDNGAFGAWDWDALANEWDALPLSEWGVPTWKVDEELNEGEEQEDNNNYSRKVEAPIYEPTGEDVPVEELTDTTKRDALLIDIERADIPDDVRHFLRLSAERHVRFNFERIADFYANANAEVQRLMEDSALVIIDFNKAIEDGFVRVTKDLLNQYDIDNGTDGGE